LKRRKKATNLRHQARTALPTPSARHFFGILGISLPPQKLKFENWALFSDSLGHRGAAFRSGFRLKMAVSGDFPGKFSAFHLPPYPAPESFWRKAAPEMSGFKGVKFALLKA
jgi:hypothetical protein